jgi:hypothetical protein
MTRDAQTRSSSDDALPYAGQDTRQLAFGRLRGLAFPPRHQCAADRSVSDAVREIVYGSR